MSECVKIYEDEIPKNWTINSLNEEEIQRAVQNVSFR